MSGKSPAGVDYYDAATIRCTNGATIALSGAATIPGHVASSDPNGHGFHLDVRIFGTEGLLSFDIERERLEVRRRDGTDTIVSFYNCLATATHRRLHSHSHRFFVQNFSTLAHILFLQVPMHHGDGAYICEEPVRRFARICCGEAVSVVGKIILPSVPRLLARSFVGSLHAVDLFVRP